MDAQDRVYKTAYVCYGILVITLIAYIIGNIIAPVFQYWGDLRPDRVLVYREYYRLVTPVFLHEGVEHIAGNMIMLFVFGALIENYTGHLVFAILYLMTGIAGNVLTIHYELEMGEDFASLGASGAVMGIIGFTFAWVIVRGISSLGNKAMLGRFMVLGIYVYRSVQYQEGVNNIAHIGGFVAGFIIGIINIVIFKNNKRMEGLE